MSFTIRNLTGSAVVIDDLGLTIPASTDVDLTDLQPNDVAVSADLITEIAAGNLAMLDPLDGVTVLNIADSTEVIQSHNDPHWGIRAGELDQLDDVATSGQSTDDILQFNGTTYVPVSPADLAGDMNLGDLGDVDDLAAHTLDSIVVFKGDGTNFDTVIASADSDFQEVIEDYVGSLIGDGADTTVVYTDGSGTLVINVDDVFLRNTGDVLDSGTLTIASGANINIATGGDLTIQDAPTVGTDAANKTYVDSVAAGLDPKESVTGSTLLDISGTYASGGGAGGTGEFTAVDLTSNAIFDNVPLNFGGFGVGDRILVKNQGTATENGIYVVTTAGAAGVIERASDQDGSPTNEVSGGNFTFVEGGDTLQNTGWVLQGTGELTLNTDDMDWVQFSESTNIQTGIGLAQGGPDFDLDVNNLTTASIVSADLLAFHDGDGAAETSGSQTRNITAANFIGDLNILTGSGGNLTASDGVLITVGDDIQLDITNLGAAAITGVDELVFDDGASGSHSKTTVTSFLNSLDIVNSLGGNGFAVQTAADTYVARTITIDGAGALDGLAITNGDGVAGNPVIGLDINGLPARSDAVDTTDRIAVFNITSGANEYYTVAELAGAAGASDSFNTWSGGGNTTGDGTVVADSSADTVNIQGGVGINLDLTAASDTVVWSFGNFGMVDTAVVLADTVPFFDASNSNDPEFRSWTDIITDLGITTGVTASVDEDELGIVITGGDTVGFTIDTLTNPVEDLAATDEFAVHNKSEGTAGANRKITGQEVADGVLNITNLTGLTVTTIGGQEVLTLIDTTRSNKVLSIESTTFIWSENNVGNNDWIQVGNANDADSGFVMPLDATIVKVVAHTENDSGNSKDIDLYIDAVNNGAIASFTAVTGENLDTDVTVDIDVNAGQKLRLRGGATGGVIQDTIVTLWVKWRG